MQTFFGYLFESLLLQSEQMFPAKLGESPRKGLLALSTSFLLHTFQSWYSLPALHKQKPPGMVGLLAKLVSSAQTPVDAGVFKGVHGVGDDRKGDLEVTSVASQKANEPAAWHI